MKLLATFLVALVASSCAHRQVAPAPKFGASLIFPGGGTSGGGGGGSVTQGTSPWVTAIRDQGTLATVDYGDTANKAARVNIVAGASSGAVAQGSTTSGQTGGLTQGAVTTAAPTYTTAQTDPLSLTTAGALRTDSSATTQPVSGTVTVVPSGTQTVAGNLTHNNAAPAATNVGALGALANAADPTFTEGRLVLHSVDLTGYMRALVKGTVAVSGTVAVTQSGTWTVQPGNTANTTAWKVDGSAVTQPVSGTVAATQSGAWSLSANQSVNEAQINGVAPLMGNGVTGTGSQRVTIASDNTAFTVNSAQSGTWTVQPGNTANTTAWKVDGSAVTQPVSGTVTALNPTVASATLTSVSGSASSVTCVASNASRRGAFIYNDSTALLYVAFAATSSTSAFTVRVASQGYYEMPSYSVYTGIITCIWASATGAARVTEIQ